jgi:hypothetical protein
MPFVLDDAVAVVAKEVTADVVKKGAEITNKEASSKVFDSKVFNHISSDVKDSDAKFIRGFHENSSSHLDMEDDFSPDKFNENGEELNDKIESEDLPTEKIELTSTFEEQTIDNFQLEEIRPEIEGNLKLGYPHDGDILRCNLEAVTGTNPENSNAHHLVGSDTPEAAKKLEEFGIDRNDPANGIFLPDSPESALKGSIHGQGRHIAEYSNEVEQRFAGVTSREENLEVLQSLKEDLYNGDLALHYDVLPNK